MDNFIVVLILAFLEHQTKIDGTLLWNSYCEGKRHCSDVATLQRAVVGVVGGTLIHADTTDGSDWVIVVLDQYTQLGRDICTIVLMRQFISPLSF